MSNVQAKIVTDEWVSASWEEYLSLIEDPAFEQARGYYYNEQMRIEMAPLGHDHASDNTIICLAVNLFGIVKNVSLKALLNCSYRKRGLSECQPDISYYIGERVCAVPRGTSIINLNEFPPPNLVIEVAGTSLADDLGGKRLMYEDLQISEYWVVDVEKAIVTAFSIAEGGSRRIRESGVLPGFSIGLVEEALQRNQQGNQSEVGAWLLTQWQ